MFERFTDRSRRVMVLARQEALLLNHNFIGTEHVLLGLIGEGDGVAANALASLGITPEAVRGKIEEILGTGGTLLMGSPPFTPEAKKALELARREALALGENDIDTEHVLLGIIREGEAVGVQVLVALGANLLDVREEVIRLRVETSSGEPGGKFRRLDDLMGCSFCGKDQAQVGKLIAGRGAYICAEYVQRCRDIFAADDDEA